MIVQTYIYITEVHCLLFIRTKDTEVTQGKLPFVKKSLNSETSDLKGTPGIVTTTKVDALDCWVKVVQHNRGCTAIVLSGL